MMTERDRLLDDLDRTYRGDPWCGGSLREVLEGVTAEVASRRFPPLSHSIAEVVMHLSAWYGAVLRRISGGPVELPEEGDWPPAGAGWDASLRGLEARHERLLALVAAMPEHRLSEVVGNSRDRAMGTGMTVGATLNGLSQHTVYHAGQVALLKKLGDQR